jgi:putative transposase
MESYRIHEGAGLYFVTFTVVDWLPVFIEEPPCKIITDSFRYCGEQKYLRVNTYVIMPHHIHAIVFDADFDNQRLKHTLEDLRKFTGRQMLDYCAHHAPPSFEQVFTGRAGEDRQRRFWQSTQHAVGITTEKFWQQKMDYIHQNPCRKGLARLAEDWRFSSAAYWIKGVEGDVPVAEVMW